MSNEVKGAGAKLQISDDGTTWNDVAAITKLDPLDRKQNMQETTTLDSLAEEHSGSIPNNGTIKGTIKFDPVDTQHAAMETAFAAATKKYWRVRLPTTPNQTRYTCQGVVSAFKLTSVDAKVAAITADFEITISGALTKATDSEA